LATRPEPNLAQDWPAEPGTYLLWLTLAQPLMLTVGRLGQFDLAPGHYAYVGSAHGPGGLRARVGRHLRKEKRLHWHADYLAAVLSIRYIHAVSTPQKLECAWTRQLLVLPGASVPIYGFGNADCRDGCPAHLVRLPDDYDFPKLTEILHTCSGKVGLTLRDSHRLSTIDHHA